MKFLKKFSDQSKAKIGLALKKIWSKRLGRKILKERCYWAWAGAIAEAAQKGGLGQRELEWDSYEKMNSEILSHHLQWKAERERQKEIERRRAERALKSKSEKPVEHSQRIVEVKHQKSKENTKKPGERKNTVSTPKNAKLKAKFVKVTISPLQSSNIDMFRLIIFGFIWFEDPSEATVGRIQGGPEAANS